MQHFVTYWLFSIFQLATCIKAESHSAALLGLGWFGTLGCCPKAFNDPGEFL